MDQPLLARACPVCDTGNDFRIFAEAAFDTKALDAFAYASRKVPEYMHYRLLECRRCDALYSSPAPAEAALEHAYHDAAFDSGEEARFASLAYAEFLPAILQKLTHRKCALDIGTGDGAFLEQLDHYGFERLIGVEPSEAPIAAAKPWIRPLIRKGLFRAAEFEAGSFSLITCFQTLEHVYDPIALCEQAYALLKEGGSFFVVSHNRRALSAQLLGLKSPIFDIEHLQLFSPRSLRQALERVGFTEIEFHPVLNRYPLHYWLKLFPLRPDLKSRLLTRLKQTRLGNLPIKIAAGNVAAVAYKRSSKVARRTRIVRPTGPTALQ
jgi:SAM-dependent methyltransferase